MRRRLHRGRERLRVQRPRRLARTCAGSRGRVRPRDVASTSVQPDDVLGALDEVSVKARACRRVPGESRPQLAAARDRPRRRARRPVRMEQPWSQRRVRRRRLPAARSVRRVRVLGRRAISVRPGHPRDPRDPERRHRADAEPSRHAARVSRRDAIRRPGPLRRVGPLWTRTFAPDVERAVVLGDRLVGSRPTRRRCARAARHRAPLGEGRARAADAAACSWRCAGRSPRSLRCATAGWTRSRSAPTAR